MINQIANRNFVLGRDSERERILSLWEAEMKCPCEEPMQHLLVRIKGDPLKELQRLAEETGEHENFDNPLIKENKQ